MAPKKKRNRGKKQPRVAVEPAPEKFPKAAEPHVDGLPLAWRFSACDKGGSWAWTGLDAAGEYKRVMEKLHQFETMNWSEIGRDGSHPIEVSKLAKGARDRLTRIKQNDLDDLMSFRLTGKNRVWCVRDRNIMRVLWWDPDHTVCPSIKKHT